MNLLDLYAKISIDTSDYDKGISDAEQKSNGLFNTFKKFGSVAGTVAKAGAAVAVAGVTAVGAITKSALSGYAEYEQLVGGVETLFGRSANIVEAYAQNAYKTAGMTANEYMETVTGFSASLLQSMGGDTQSAAHKANQAIQDMSDNANKMGSDMTSIQNAYAGFAKQNWSMLDNLKIGYGGTKEEMQRLLSDANKINAEHGKTTQYTLDSYADVIDAIHTVQTEMGITGTTALEAEKTISGSASMMKAAWSNLITGLGDENANFERLTDDVIDSAMAYAENVIPRVETILSHIADALPVMWEKVGDDLHNIFENVLPQLFETAGTAIFSFGEWLVGALPGIWDGIIDGFSNMFDAMSQAALASGHEVLAGFLGLVGDAIQWLGDAIAWLTDTTISAISNSGENLTFFNSPDAMDPTAVMDYMNAQLEAADASAASAETAGQASEAISALSDTASSAGETLAGYGEVFPELAEQAESGTASMEQNAQANLSNMEADFQSSMSNAEQIVAQSMANMRAMASAGININVNTNVAGGQTIMHAKAMSNAYMLTGATIFGRMGDQYLGGGENGNEVVIGENSLYRSIHNASGASEMIPYLREMVSIMQTYLPQAASSKVFSPNGSFIGEMANEVERQMGYNLKQAMRASV